LEETSLTPSSLQLEITENILLENFQSALEILKKLKALNVGLKVDDFGTGYSCLQYLSQLPFDTVKIDRSFTGSMSADNANAEIVRSILSMAHHLGMDVVAEGVEKSDQAAQLLSMGCDYGQGFYFCKPLAAPRVKELLGSVTQSSYRENVATDHSKGPVAYNCAAVGSGDGS
jgi:EAL domain-containing protein (putative c-di-GMP-specific phosphodiesterase class I)